MQPHHVTDADRTCPRCRTFILARIPHECNPDICIKCNGNKNVWGKQGWEDCPACNGTGRTKWGDDNKIGAAV